MKNNWLIVILFIILGGLSVFLFTNCGGVSLTSEQNNLTEKNWSLVGGAGFSAGAATNFSLSLYRDTPYIAYVDDMNKISVMKFNGGTWESVSTTDFYTLYLASFSLAVYNSTPYVAYRDARIFGTGKDARFGLATVMKFNGASWESVGPPGFTEGEAAYISLAVDNGIPFIAYFDSTIGVTVMKFNGSSWENVGTPNFTVGLPTSLSFAVNNGTPFAAYADMANGEKATVVKFNGSTWESVGTPSFSAADINSPSLSVYNGTPYLAYEDHDPRFVGPKDDLSPKVTVMKFNGASWECVGSQGFVQGEPVYLQVYNGTPYVAFVEDLGLYYGRVSVMKFNGSDWEYVGNQGFSNHVHSAFDVSLSISDNGTPYVVYSDVDNGNKATVMRYE